MPTHAKVLRPPSPLKNQKHRSSVIPSCVSTLPPAVAIHPRWASFLHLHFLCSARRKASGGVSPEARACSNRFGFLDRVGRFASGSVRKAWSSTDREVNAFTVHARLHACRLRMHRFGPVSPFTKRSSLYMEIIAFSFHSWLLTQTRSRHSLRPASPPARPRTPAGRRRRSATRPPSYCTAARARRG